MNIVNENIKAKYPGVIIDATTIILENQNINLNGASDNPPAGTLLFIDFSTKTYKVLNQSLPSLLPVYGIVLEYNPDTGKGTVLVRGIYQGKVYYWNTVINQYEEGIPPNVRIINNIIIME